MTPKTPQTLTLSAGPLRCDIMPTLGGCVAGLWWQAEAILLNQPPSYLQIPQASARDAASYALIPYSNRIGNARLDWLGQTYALRKNFSPEPHALHGVAWERAWAVHSHSASHIELHYAHAADSSWPFAFDATQAMSLDARGLTVALSVTNRHTSHAPAGLGWHPYFAKRAGMRLSFSAAGRWAMGADKLPTHLEATSGLVADCATLDVDHCFEGVAGTIRLTDPAFTVEVSSSTQRLVVFTRPERDNIAIEPVSHVNNALNLAASTGQPFEVLGMRSLAVGERMNYEMHIEIKRTLGR